MIGTIIGSPTTGETDVQFRGVQTSVAAGDTIANKDTDTNFATTFDIAAGTLAVGDIIHVKAHGVHSSTGNPNKTVKVKLDTTVLGSTGAVTCGAVETDVMWVVDFYMVVTSIGATGTIEAHGYHGEKFDGSNQFHYQMTNTAAITVNTTTTLTVAVGWQWATAAAGNTATMRQLIVEVLNPIS